MIRSEKSATVRLHARRGPHAARRRPPVRRLLRASASSRRSSITASSSASWRAPASAPVPATLAGYVAGGVVSYRLNRRHTYASDRPHAEAGWRFARSRCVGFLITGASCRPSRPGSGALPAGAGRHDRPRAGVELPGEPDLDLRAPPGRPAPLTRRLRPAAPRRSCAPGCGRYCRRRRSAAKPQSRRISIISVSPYWSTSPSSLRIRR